MRYPPVILEQIKARVSLVEEVRKVAPSLKKKGRYFWACCPFHGEKTASFHVRDEGNYYCFGCGASGDVFSFIQETQGGTFTDVVQRLARQAGVTLPEPERVDPAAAQKRTDGIKALERAMLFYQRCLLGDPRGPAAAYIAKRGLSATTVAEFGLGFAPDAWRELSDALVNEGFAFSTLLETGLAVESDKKDSSGVARTYDRFRNRVMFPIHDLSDRVVGFGGRVMDTGEPKYLNSPETPFFSKSHLLFNLNRARPHIKQTGMAVLVEGYMDVISLWQAGFKTALAPMGTAVTEDQLVRLWQHHHAPIVCLDGDSAGRAAAIRAAQRALGVLEPGKSLQFVFLPQGEDPDSLVQKDGLGAFRQLLAQPVPLENVLWQHLTAGVDLSHADGRTAVESEMGALLATIRHTTVKRAYTQVLKEKLWQATRGGRPSKVSSSSVALTAPVDYRPGLSGEMPARMLLALTCAFPQLLDDVVEEFAALSFPPGPLKDLSAALFRAYSSHTVDVGDIPAFLAEGPLGDVYSDLLRTCGIDTLEALSEARAKTKEVLTDLTAQKAAKKWKDVQKTMKPDDIFGKMWQEFQTLHPAFKSSKE